MEWERYADGEPMEPGNTWILFIDDYFVEDRFGLERVIGDVIKLPVNPVLIPDRPWEDSVGSPSVVWDAEAGKYRMWYKVFNTSSYSRQFLRKEWTPGKYPPAYFISYAESRDGVRWDKPDLSIQPFGDREHTNIVFFGTQRAQEHHVWLNDGAGERKFLMTYKDATLNDGMGLWLAYSADGIHWTIDSERSPLAVHLRDGAHLTVHDEERRRWLYFRRPPALAQRPEQAVANIQRRYGVSTAADLAPHAWTYPRMALIPDEEVEAPWIDGLTVFKRGSHFICLYSTLDERIEGPAEVFVASSRDGLQWSRMPHRPVFLGRGREGDFDAGEARNPASIVDMGETSWLYYSGNMGFQKGNRGGFGSIGIAKMRKDRWMGLKTIGTEGWMLTRELTVSGEKLQLNHYGRWVPYPERIAGDTTGPKTKYSRGKNGFIRVELLRRSKRGQDLEPIEGFGLDDCVPVVGDGTDTVVKWTHGRDLSSLRGESIFIRFHFIESELYGMRFESDNTSAVQ